MLLALALLQAVTPTVTRTTVDEAPFELVERVFIAPGAFEASTRHVMSCSGALHVWARCEGADLVLHVARSAENFEDDDSGGRPTPYVAVPLSAGEAVDVRVRSKAPADARREIELHFAASPELAEASDLLAKGKTVLEKAQNPPAVGDRAAAREAVRETVASILSAPRLEDDFRVVQLLYDLGRTARELADPTTARDAHLLVARQRARALPPDHPELLRAIHQLAIAHQELGELDLAEPHQRRLVDAWDRTLAADARERSDARANLSLTRFYRGDSSAARELQSEALAGYLRIFPPEHETVLSARLNLGAIHHERSELDEAARQFDQILAVRSLTTHPDDKLAMFAETSRSSVHFSRGDVRRAKLGYERALAAYSKHFPESARQRLLLEYNLATASKALGRLEEARASLERVVAIHERTRPPEDFELLRARLGLASVREQQGDLEGASILFERGLEVLKRTRPEDDSYRLDTELNLALVLLRRSEPHLARKHVETAIAGYERTRPPDDADVLRARAVAASIHADLGEDDEARSIKQDIFELQERSLRPDHPDMVFSCLAMGAEHAKRGELDQARALLDRAVADSERIYPSHGSRLLLARVHRLRVLLAQREAAAALEEVDRWLAGALERTLQSVVLSPREIRSIGASTESELMIALTAAEGGGQELTTRLFELIETQRSFTALGTRCAAFLETDPVLAGLADDAASVRGEIARRLEQPRTDADEEKTAEEVASLGLERDRLDRELRVRMTERGVVARPMSAKELSRALPKGSAAVGYRRYIRWSPPAKAGELPLDEDRLLAHVLRPDGSVARLDLGTITELDALVTTWRTAIGKPVHRGAAVVANSGIVSSSILGERLRNALLDPILLAAGPETRQLFVCPDDLVFLVPLDALPLDEGLSGTKLSIVGLPSFAALTERPRARRADRSLLLLGAVEFGAGSGEAVAVEASSARRQSTHAFEPLLQTEFEIESIAALFERSGGGKPDLLRGSAATRSGLLARLPRSTHVHLATHAWFDPESVRSTLDGASGELRSGSPALETVVTGFAPMALCGLALAGANDAPSDAERADSRLTAEELAGADLSACELAVLSACETNVGSSRAGQGIQSLQAALHAAGARATITSIWKVDDAATRKLMEHFYTDLWSKGLAPRDALWGARMRLRAAGHSAADWAGWVYSGVSSD